MRGIVRGALPHKIPETALCSKERKEAFGSTKAMVIAMEKSGLKQMKFGKEKLKTIWYYYKWMLAACGALLVLFCALIFQCTARQNSDIYIYYAGPVYFPAEVQKEVSAAFEAVIPDECAKSVGMITTVIGSKIDVAETGKEEQGVQNYVGQKETLQEFKNQMILPNSVICILSPTCFENSCGTAGALTLRSLEFLIDDLPDLTLTSNGYGIPLSALPFYKSNTVLKNFPADSILCLKSGSLLRDDSDYEQQIEAFKAILNFTLK